MSNIKTLAILNEEVVVEAKWNEKKQCATYNYPRGYIDYWIPCNERVKVFTDKIITCTCEKEVKCKDRLKYYDAHEKEIKYEKTGISKSNFLTVDAFNKYIEPCILGSIERIILVNQKNIC